MNNIGLLTVEEVAVSVGVSVPTINNWYRWARQNEDNEQAKKLPKYAQIGNRQTRFWKPADVMKLIEFKNSVTIGRNGIMGDVTQKYVRRKTHE